MKEREKAVTGRAKEESGKNVCISHLMPFRCCEDSCCCEAAVVVAATLESSIMSAEAAESPTTEEEGSKGNEFGEDAEAEGETVEPAVVCPDMGKEALAGGN